MKLSAPITNSSNFYSVVWFSDVASTLPINEAAIVAYHLFGADGNMIAIKTNSVSRIEEVYEREKRGRRRCPRLIRSFPKLPGSDAVNFVGHDFQDRMVYATSPRVLTRLSSFPWIPNDEISGWMKWAQDGSERKEEWEVVLLDMDVPASASARYTGVAAAIILPDCFLYPWDSLIEKMMDIVPSPPYLKDVISIWRNGTYAGMYLFFGDVLIMDYFCLWEIGNGIVCGISPLARQSDPRELEEIALGAQLIQERKANIRHLQV